MLNWRRIAVTGLVAGIVAVTGCSTNLPETNQGNRNGQRVVDSVNRRTDTYRGTGIERDSYRDGYVGRTTRGIRRATHNVANPARTTTGNSLNIGRPGGRVGNTFRYGNNRGVTRGLHSGRIADYNCYENYNCDGIAEGYDYGVSVTDRALLNNRTTRSTTVAPAVTPSTEKTETKRVDTTRKATPDKPAKSAKPAAKKAETKKVETHKTEAHKPAVHNVTRSAAPAPAAPKVPSRTNTAPNARAKFNQTTRSHTNRVESNHVRGNQARHIAPNQNTSPIRTQVNRYGMNHNVNRPNRNVNRYNNGINMAAPINAIDQTVAVVNNEDSLINEDMAFFRKKTEEPKNTVPPATVPGEPAPVPAPRMQSYNDGHDNGYYNDYDNGYDYNENQPPPQPAPTAPAKLPVRTTATRIAK